MTGRDKEGLCLLLAAFFSPPDRELADQTQKGLIHSYLHRRTADWPREGRILEGFCMEGEVTSLSEILDREYERLFSCLNSERVSLVESSYKSWTEDLGCCLPFSREKGLLMGDSALHLSELYMQCAIQPSDHFSDSPDHLVLELEFLSCLYRWGTDAEISMFIRDHLDWIPLMGERLRRLDPHPFYLSAFEVLDGFVRTERERLKAGNHGKKILR